MRSIGIIVLVGITVAVCDAIGRHKDKHRRNTESSTMGISEIASPLVSAECGSFRGSWMKTRRGKSIQAYRGIRYAEPPTGELRFQPPRLISQYPEEVDATEEGPACPQPIYDNTSVDEDCLRLNVYTHGPTNKPRPVVVFIHAGGFYSVSGRSDVAGPHYLLDRDVVLVTINYRLASLGFLSTGDKFAPGNNGFKDQVAALRWVQKNIRAFGGDPGLVTIAGYSAGSFSVFLHMVSPMSKGTFHRAISMSGAPISQIVLPAHQRHLADKQAKLLNCPTNNTEDMIKCLKNKTAKEIADTLDSFAEFAYDPVLMWVPVIEEDFGQERFLVEQPLESIRRGNMHPVPYIISQTQDEFFWKAFTILGNDSFLSTMNDEWHRVAPIAFQLPPNSNAAADKLKEAYLHNKPLVNDTESAKALGKLYNDGIIGFGVYRTARLMSQHSPHPVYYYEFGYIGNHSHYEDPVTKKPVGAAHHDDLIYLFTISAIFPTIAVSDSLDSRTVDKMTAIWYNFMRYGDPNPRDDTPELAGLSWPRMDADKRQYIRIDKDFSLHEKLFEDRFNVWEELYPIKY